MDFHLIGIVSDSHDNVVFVQEVMRVFRQYGVEHILHCGDVTDPETARYFSDSGVKTTFVIGNNDRSDEIRNVAKEIGAEAHEQPFCFNLYGKKVFLVHGHENADQQAEDAYYSGEWDLVCYGHNHKQFKKNENGTILINPGALTFGDFCLLGPGGVEMMNLSDMENE